MNKTLMTKRFLAFATVACLGAGPAFAAVTDISDTPLSSGAAPVLPNLMFLLDDTGTMDFDYLPDYVVGGVGGAFAKGRIGSTEACEKGDPCYYAGGPNGYNGVYYDPNINYRAGLKYDNTPYNTQNTFPLSLTSLKEDAYVGGSNVNLTTANSAVGTDKKYCNSAGVCKRNGAVDSTGAVTASGLLDGDTKTDGTTFTMAAGQFPYRAHQSNSSIQAFALPEVLPQMLSWTRATTTATITTAAPHGLVAGNALYVTGTGNTNIDGFSRPVLASGLTATQFQITVVNGGGTSGSVGAYRKHTTGATYLRALTVVTVTTPGGHGLTQGDTIVIDSSDNNQDKSTAVTPTIVLPTTFTYTGANSGAATGTATWARVSLYNVESSFDSKPITYRITPVEYCDVNLSTCQLATTPGTSPASGLFPAYVRYCKTQADAVAPGVVTGNSGTTPNTPRCVSKFFNTAPSGGSAYTFVRYGLFQREHILNSGSYANRPGRNDCASPPNCTSTEEMQNYARWYTFYRTRLQTMKTAAGRAFTSLVSKPTASPAVPNKIRMGFITLNPCGSANAAFGCSIQTSTRYLKVDNFDGTTSTSHAANFYSRLYNVGSGSVGTIGFTPMPEALSRVGWIFAGKFGSGLTSNLTASADDPVLASCQKNFALITTDGYWNDVKGRKLDGTLMDNQDNVDGQTIPGYTDPVVSRATGTFDGALSNVVPACSGANCTAPGGAGTLADVAMYYYKNDLRGGSSPHTGPATNGAGTNVATNNVPVKPQDKNFLTHQNMVTFAIGMSDGLMRYQTDYETSTTGDFANIKNGASSCVWSPGATCNWPVPEGNESSAIDDVWHAAVNSRGSYYSARDTTAVATGLESALNALNVQVAAAAASSTSSPNITFTDRQIFSTTYETDVWSGRIVAQNIDPITGSVEPTILWRADVNLLSKVGAASDSRVIKTFDNAATNKVKNFAWAELTSAEQNYFRNICSTSASNMTQCSGISGGATQPDVNDGSKMVGYLRGWTGLELNTDLSVGSFRDRKFIDPATNATSQTILGDTINARPAYVRAPLLEYGDAGYAAHKTAMTSRAPRLYVGANDGYLHAFDGGTGDEAWSYLPKFLMPGLWVLADSGYKTRHTYFADGSPETADVYDTTAAAWKTILVAGVNKGGRGYYALDITDPNTPKGLWEFCADSTICTRSNVNLGLSYGNPVIGKRSSDGRWVVVVTSGLNNAGGVGGDGKGYFFVLDAITGAILNTVAVDASIGSTTTPSGLAKISAFYDNPNADATFRYVYGGDQLGNMWRLDMGTSAAPTPTVLHLATLKDVADKVQPITTRPVLTTIGANKVIYIGTGRYLGARDLTNPTTQTPVDNVTAWQQTLYAFKDKGTDYGTDIRTGSTFVTQTISNLSPTTRTISTNAVDWNTKDGWLMDFNPSNDSPGERVNIDMELVLGTLIVTTNVPISGSGASCAVGGDSWQYQLDFRTGSALSTSTGGVAGTKTGSVVTVGVAVVQLPSGAIKSIVTGADTSKSTISVNIGAGSGTVRRFSYRER